MAGLLGCASKPAADDGVVFVEASSKLPVSVAASEPTAKGANLDPAKYTTILPRSAGNDAQQVGRYTTQRATPPQSAGDPMAVVAHISFPRSTVRTVSDAMNHTLLRTGYQMAANAELGPQAVQFLALPLPESQRQLGPYQVETILGILLGAPWEIQLQPITRRVVMQLAPAYRSASSVGTSTSHNTSTSATTAASNDAAVSKAVAP